MASVIIEKLGGLAMGLLNSPNMPTPRPVLNDRLESNVPGLFVVGDLAGAPVVKLAMEQGNRVAEYIASLPGARGADPDVLDLLVIGAGASGLNAALAAQALGLRVLVLEKAKFANTIEDFPEGKWVYAEPESRPAAGKLWLEGATKEDLLARWQEAVRENNLDVRTCEGVSEVERRSDGTFDVRTARRTYRARRVVLAAGQRGNPRKLGVPGEDGERISHRLYSPGTYHSADILVVGGGNTAAEAALALAEHNTVTLSYRGVRFSRLFRDNRRKLEQAAAEGRIHLLLDSRVTKFAAGAAQLEISRGAAKVVKEIPYHHAFVLIGAEVPAAFLRSLGLRLENDWTGNPASAFALAAAAGTGLWLGGGQTGFAAVQDLRWLGVLLALVSCATLVRNSLRGSRFALLGLTFLLAYTIYGAKLGHGHELWPYRGWGYRALSFFNRPWAFWYTVLYTALMTGFGIQAMKRWGFHRKDRFQIWRYASLLGFQWVFFFLIPEFLFQWSVKYQWVGESLARDPVFADQAWRSYGIVYAWPLFFYTFFGEPHQIWVVWGVILSFVILPVLALFHGKRYCSWVCGCGGLAETLGDRWRHLAPKGGNSIRWERMNLWVFVAAAAITAVLAGRDLFQVFQRPAGAALEWYRLIVDVWLVGIVPVTLYPFFGGKVWCRYWCPLAKMMEIFSRVFTRFRLSRFAIQANEKCIACGECTRNCQVGIDVMSFALKQQDLNNYNTSCIGCGICVTVCPMNVLSFKTENKTKLVQIQPARPKRQAAT